MVVVVVVNPLEREKLKVRIPDSFILSLFSKMGRSERGRVKCDFASPARRGSQARPGGDWVGQRPGSPVEGG